MKSNKSSGCIRSQLLSSLYMLKDCIDRCPDEEWDESHKDYPFSRVVFHTLFDCDLNLSDNEKEFKDQEIQREYRHEFGEYEELEGRISERTYSRDFIERYYSHSIGKVVSVLEAKIDDVLLLHNSDYYGSMTKMERYINCIRHTQHHAAQLGIRLQFITGKEMKWIGRSDELK